MQCMLKMSYPDQLCTICLQLGHYRDRCWRHAPVPPPPDPPPKFPNPTYPPPPNGCRILQRGGLQPAKLFWSHNWLRFVRVLLVNEMLNERLTMARMKNWFSH